MMDLRAYKSVCHASARAVLALRHKCAVQVEMPTGLMVQLCCLNQILLPSTCILRELLYAARWLKELYCSFMEAFLSAL